MNRIDLINCEIQYSSNNWKCFFSNEFNEFNGLLYDNYDVESLGYFTDLN